MKLGFSNNISFNRLNSKQWLKTGDTDRLYLFVDESGDTGLTSQESASKYFIINILACDSRGVNILEKHFSRYRYFRHADKELKKYRSSHQSQDLLDDLLINCLETNNVFCFSFCVDKEKYIGPYLNCINKELDDYDATKFRNFITKIALENVFLNIPVVKIIDNKFRSIEVIIDRYLENKEDEENFKKYLNGNYNLPTIQFINQLDSNYCSQLQIADVLGDIVKRKVFHNEVLNTKGIKIFVIDNPRSILEYKEKGPDTQLGTGTFSSISI